MREESTRARNWRRRVYLRITFEFTCANSPTRIGLTWAKRNPSAEHLAGVPLLPSIRKTLHQVYLQKGALATTAIEGNTLTEEEVAKLVSGKLRLLQGVPGPRRYEYP